MKTSLKISTSFVSPVTMEIFKKHNVLPIFIIRKIKNSDLIGNFEGTSIHFKELSPSNELFRIKRDGLISFEEFSKRYILEVSENVDFDSVIKRWENLADISGASSIVLLGYGSNEKNCHRSVLSDLLNSMNIINDRITEIIW